MFISVVIPTYTLLEDCIQALSPTVQKPSCDYEVIVSDDRIPSSSKLMLEEKYPWVMWVEGPHKGVAANRNNGAKYAKGKWIVFIDNDCIPNENLLNNYLDAIKQNPQVLVFEGRISPDRKKQNFLEESPINEFGGLFWTCNVMIQKKYFFESLQGFDENFYMYHEDVDIRERIKKDGQVILFVRQAFVIHPWRINKMPLEMIKQKAVAHPYLLKKHPHLIPSKNFIHRLKVEIRFYRDILYHIIPYGGRGLFMHIKMHYFDKKIYKVHFSKTLDNTENWTRFYD